MRRYCVSQDVLSKANKLAAPPHWFGPRRHGLERPKLCRHTLGPGIFKKLTRNEDGRVLTTGSETEIISSASLLL